MELIFTLACLLFSATFFAQQPATASKNRPQIGLVFGGDSDFRVLFESDNSPSGGAVKRFRDEFEKPGLGRRIGADFLFPVSEKWSLKTGLRLAEQGYFLKIDSLRWPSENQNGVWVFDPSLPHSIKFYERHIFLETPVSMQFSVKKGGWKFFSEGGCSILWYLKSRYIQDFDLGKDAVDTRREPLAAVHFMAIFSVGLERFFRQGRSSIFVQPIGRFQCTPIRFGVPIREFPYNFGAEIGLRHSL